MYNVQYMLSRRWRNERADWVVHPGFYHAASPPGVVMQSEVGKEVPQDFRKYPDKAACKEGPSAADPVNPCRPVIPVGLPG